MEKGHDNTSSPQMNMPMMFFSTTASSKLLVEHWTTASMTGLLLAVATGAVLSLSLESLKHYRLSRQIIFYLFKLSSSRLSVPKQLFASLLHMMDITLAHLLMFLVMTFNIYIIIAVILGAGLGHFIFRPLFLKRVNVRLQRRERVLRILTSPMLSDEDQCPDPMDSDINGIKEDSLDNIIQHTEEESLMQDQQFDPMMSCLQFRVKGKETSV